MSLSARGAVVTGGGSGIGAAVARALAEAGAAVVVAARNTRRIEGVAARLSDSGYRSWAIACDVADVESVVRLAEAARERMGRVDILVNSAGVAFSAPLHNLAPADWNRVLAVNATGTFLCTQAFLPEMAERKWGRVVNLASTAGLRGGRYIAAYAASKHAVVGFTRSVAEEIAAKGVTINAVCPGFVDTPMTDASLDRIVRATGKARHEVLERILDTTPQRRLIQPEEVAHAVLSLCDERARGINGQCIVIDGGSLLA